MSLLVIVFLFVFLALFLLTTCVNHTISEERGGDYHDMASSQGALSEGEKRKRVGFDWWMVWK